MESYGKSTFSRLLSCVEEIHGRHVEFENYFLGSPHHLSRPRRQLAALAGIGIGVLAIYDVETLCEFSCNLSYISYVHHRIYTLYWAEGAALNPFSCICMCIHQCSSG